jgi:hypothetical protein
MKDKTYYFPHDYNARNDPKLQDVLIEHGAAGLGVFWCIVEQLYEQGGELPLRSCKGIAFALHQECTMVESIVNDFGLFENNGESFWSNSVNKRIGKRQQISERRKQAALTRWQSTASQQVQSTPDANAMQKDAKEKKRKEINNSISNDIDREKPHSRFVPPTLEEVQAYIVEKGYSVDAESFIAFYQSKNWYVGKNKMKDWKAAILTWEKREREQPRRTTPRKPKTSESRNVNDEWQ